MANLFVGEGETELAAEVFDARVLGLAASVGEEHVVDVMGVEEAEGGGGAGDSARAVEEDAINTRYY